MESSFWKFLLPVFWAAILLLSQCRERVAKIDVEFQPMLDSFMHEASKRGVKLSAERGGLLIRFGRMKGKNGGSCRPNTYPKVITIDSIKWNYIDPQEREALLFHELAHCLLLRSHRNDVFEFGECKSLLREEVAKCALHWENVQWRQYYLDELFLSSKAKEPYWYVYKPEFPPLEDLSPLRTIRLRGSKFHYLDSIYADNPRNWIFHITGKTPAANSHIGLTINEIQLETSYRRTRDQIAFIPALIVMKTHPRRILMEVTAMTDVMDLSVQKKGNIIYIYFGGTLRYVLPVKLSNLRIGAYSSFPEGHYDINFYAI